jgi:glycosyltransferase involved in cell wall biosynthesis
VIKIPFTLCVTTFNNAATIEKCLRSIPGVDEIVVLDSFSTDETLAIAHACGAKVVQQEFAGYGQQKADCIAMAKNDWILLLDSDEWLANADATLIQELLVGTSNYGFTFPRRERLFWRYQHSATRHNRFLRLFDRRYYRMSTADIHAAPIVQGPVGRSSFFIMHDGEMSVHIKVAKINHYSTDLAAHYNLQQRHFTRTRMLLYPPFIFLRQYFFKRQFLNGWAGVIASVTMSFYGFLKYAKLFELRKSERTPEQIALKNNA